MTLGILHNPINLAFKDGSVPSSRIEKLFFENNLRDFSKHLEFSSIKKFDTSVSYTADTVQLECTRST